MAKPTTIRFGKFIVQLGTDTAGSITYTAPCGFTSKSLQFSKDLNDVQIPDCEDPDAVAWLGRDVASLSAQVSGEGVLAQEAVDSWLEAVESIDSVPVKIILEFPAKKIEWTGLMHVSDFNVQGELGGRVTVSATLNSDGELTRVTTPITTP
ncbi:phage tail tube protein [Rhizobium sp. IMFF44]|uniref:phage tail tube protein n=1 Tax=Rhizobium sp. IMFF44 TaxID=3342350 RepID=UPI0035B97359